MKTCHAWPIRYKLKSSDSKTRVVSDTSFPAGSEFLADYKGKAYAGTAKAGKLELEDGHTFSTPSAAAGQGTGSSVNESQFWNCKFPGASKNILIEGLRGKAH